MKTLGSLSSSLYPLIHARPSRFLFLQSALTWLPSALDSMLASLSPRRVEVPARPSKPCHDGTPICGASLCSSSGCPSHCIPCSSAIVFAIEMPAMCPCRSHPLYLQDFLPLFPCCLSQCHLIKRDSHPPLSIPQPSSSFATPCVHSLPPCHHAGTNAL